MARFSLPPADVSWLDRAQSCDGVFPLSAGFVLAELDGETYAISGRYCGIPDDEETRALIVDLHCERGLVELSAEDRARAEAGESIPWLAEQVSILCRFAGTSERTVYRLARRSTSPYARGRAHRRAFDQTPEDGFATMSAEDGCMWLLAEDEANDAPVRFYTLDDGAAFVAGARFQPR